MRIDDKHLLDKVFVARTHPGSTAAAALLNAIGAKRHALDVAGVAHREDHILALDQIFVSLSNLAFDDFRTPRRCELVADFLELPANHFVEPSAAAQYFQIFDDLDREFL